MRIVPITAGELREHADALIKAHYTEIARKKHLMVLDPDWEKYELLESVGKLFGLAAYAEDRLVGYSLNFIDNHPHYRGLVYAQNDVVFVDPDYRGASVFALLNSSAERMAKGLGAKLFLLHAKEGSDLERILRKRPEYAVQDIIFAKEL